MRFILLKTALKFIGSSLKKMFLLEMFTSTRFHRIKKSFLSTFAASIAKALYFLISTLKFRDVLIVFVSTIFNSKKSFSSTCTHSTVEAPYSCIPNFFWISCLLKKLFSSFAFQRNKMEMKTSADRFVSWGIGFRMKNCKFSAVNDNTLHL